MDSKELLRKLYVFVILLSQITNAIFVIPIFLDFVFNLKNVENPSLYGVYYAILLLAHEVRYVFYVCWGRLFDNAKSQTAIKISLVIIGLSNCLLGFSKSYYLFLALRLVNGAFDNLELYSKYIIQDILRNEDKVEIKKTTTFFKNLSYVIGFSLGLLSMNTETGDEVGVSLTSSMNNKGEVSYFGINSYLFTCLLAFLINLITLVLTFFQPNFKQDYIDRKGTGMSKASRNSRGTSKITKAVKKNTNPWEGGNNTETEKENNEIKFTIRSSAMSKRNSLILFDEAGGEGKSSKVNTSKNLDTYTDNENIRNNIDNIMDNDEFMEDYSVRFDKNLTKENERETNKSNLNCTNLQTNENFDRPDNLLTANNQSVLKADDSSIPKKLGDENILQMNYDKLGDDGDDDIDKKDRDKQLELVNAAHENNLTFGGNKVKENNNHNQQSPEKNLNEGVDKDIKDIYAMGVDNADFLNPSDNLNKQSLLVSMFYMLVKASDKIYFYLFILYSFITLYSKTKEELGQSNQTNTINTNQAPEHENHIDMVKKIMLSLCLIHIIFTFIFYFLIKFLTSIPKMELFDKFKTIIKVLLAIVIVLTPIFSVGVSKLFNLKSEELFIFMSVVYCIRFILSKTTLEAYHLLIENLQNYTKLKKIKQYEIYISNPITMILGCLTCVIFTNNVINGNSEGGLPKLGDAALFVLGGINVTMLILCYVFIYFIKN